MKKVEGKAKLGEMRESTKYGKVLAEYKSLSARDKKNLNKDKLYYLLDEALGKIDLWYDLASKADMLDKELRLKDKALNKVQIMADNLDAIKNYNIELIYNLVNGEEK